MTTIIASTSSTSSRGLNPSTSRVLKIIWYQLHLLSIKLHLLSLNMHLSINQDSLNLQFLLLLFLCFKRLPWPNRNLYQWLECCKKRQWWRDKQDSVWLESLKSQTAFKMRCSSWVKGLLTHSWPHSHLPKQRIILPKKSMLVFSKITFRLCEL